MRYRYANMASIHKQAGKPNWFCAFYDPEGFRRFRTTGTGNPQIARTICVNVERAAIRQGKLSNEKALRLVRETRTAIQEIHGKLAADRAQVILEPSLRQFVQLAGGELTTHTVRSWLDSWLKGHTTASPGTLIEYRRVADMFLKFLGARANRPLTMLQPWQVEKFKELISGHVAPSTVNKALKVLKASLANAVASRQLEFNPAEHVEYLEPEESSRRPFTIPEIAGLLAAADPEWRTMVLIGFYTGLRLRDCANLTWDKVDLPGGLISVTPAKTRRKKSGKNTQLKIPIAEPLARQFADIAGDQPDAPLCPTLCGRKPSWLSAQFYNLMVKAGIVAERDHRSKGTGRDGRRAMNRISFHSLRYNTTSALRSAGVSEAISMDIVGHETEAVHRHYGKTAIEAKREALGRLPDITR